MATIVTRSGKGSPLTNNEVDANFTNLNTDKLESGDTAASLTITSADINGGTIDGVTIGGSSAGAITGTTGQFNTSLNVDGTVTADGLTVADGTSGQINVWSSAYNIQGGSAFGDMRFNAPRFRFFEDGTTLRLNIDNGDISFYEDTGTTPKFFWDASAEALILGANFSSSDKLEIRGASGQDSGIRLANDATTDFRIFNNGSEALQFNVGTSTEAMRIDSSGNVGIGSATINTFYDTAVNVYGSGNSVIQFQTSNTGTASGDGFAVGVLNGAATDAYLWNRESSNLLFGTGAAERMRIDSSGRVGIGFSAAPNATLQIAKGATAGPPAAGASTGAVCFGNDTSANAYGLVMGADGFGKGYISAQRTDGTAIFYPLAIQPNGGNVGIGTSSPEQTLHVQGGDVLISITSSVGASLIFENNAADQFSADKNYHEIDFITSTTSSETTGGFARIRAGQEVSGGDNRSFLGFWTAPDDGTATEKMRIDASGNLLVGTTSAAAKLYVEKSDTGNAFGARATSGTYTSTVGFFGANRNTTNGSFHYIDCYNYGSSTYRFRVADSGDATNTNNSYGAISDAKLKENITDASPKLDKLNQVRVVNYNLIGDERKQLGVVAQELEQVFPGMVDETPDRDADGNDLGTTTKSVKYSVFVPMLIKAMQEQQEIINDLRARVAQLEGA